MKRSEWHIAHQDDPRPEEAWFAATIDELAELGQRVEAAGESGPFARSLVGTLVTGSFDGVSVQTRANYRKVLRELGPPPRAGRPSRRRSTARERGAAGLALVGASSSGSAALIAAQSGHSGLAAAFAVAAPIILDPSVSSSESAIQRVLAQLAELPEAI